MKPGYKQTDLGVVPEEWEATTFGEVMTGFSSGATPFRGSKHFYQGPIKWVTSGELNYNIIHDTIEHISLEAVKKTNLKILPKGTFLMAITGLEAAGTRGSCAILGTEATTNQSCMALFPGKKLLTEYLYYYYVLHGDSLAFQYCQGTKQQSYTGAIVKILPILLPPVDEQKAIIKALGSVDALLISQRALLQKKRALKLAAQQALLSGAERLPGFEGKSEFELLGELIMDKPPKSPSTGPNELVSFVGMENVSEEGRLLSSKQLPINEVNKGLTYFERGDVLVAKITPCFENSKGAHVNALKTRKGFGSTEFHVLRANSNGVAEYIFHHTQSVAFRKQLENEMIGTAGQKRVPLAAILKYTLPFGHSVTEQYAVAQVLSDMEKEIAELAAQVDKTQAMKQGMMQDLLTG